MDWVARGEVGVERMRFSERGRRRLLCWEDEDREEENDELYGLLLAPGAQRELRRSDMLDAMSRPLGYPFEGRRIVHGPFDAIIGEVR